MCTCTKLLMHVSCARFEAIDGPVDSRARVMAESGGCIRRKKARSASSNIKTFMNVGGMGVDDTDNNDSRMRESSG